VSGGGDGRSDGPGTSEPTTPELAPPAVGRVKTATLKEVERTHIRAVLEQTGWLIEGANGAARILGLHPNTLRGRMQRLGIRRPDRDPA